MENEQWKMENKAVVDDRANDRVIRLQQPSILRHRSLARLRRTPAARVLLRRTARADEILPGKPSAIQTHARSGTRLPRHRPGTQPARQRDEPKAAQNARLRRRHA